MYRIRTCPVERWRVVQASEMFVCPRVFSGLTLELCDCNGLVLVGSSAGMLRDNEVTEVKVGLRKLYLCRL